MDIRMITTKITKIKTNKIKMNINKTGNGILLKKK